MDSTRLTFEGQNEQSETAAGSVSHVGGVIADRPEPSKARARAVSVSEGMLRVELTDGRILSAPLDWFPRLIEASDRERAEYELVGDGELIHWPSVDEDIDVPNLLRA